MAILEGIKTPLDIKKLDKKQLKQLCEELREKIVSAVRENGGHLSSNLGVVELTVALYYVFDFPKDKLVFDVGHQCYAHKILSDRKDVFSSLRKDGGISGFPDCTESPFDLFTTGHAGMSLSACLGLCLSRDVNGEDYSVIDVVGDGSFINGLSLESLTASNTKPKNLLVVLNDNEMSITRNRNGFYRFIANRTTDKIYIKTKKAIKKVFGSNSIFVRFLKKQREVVQRVLNRNHYLETFGFKYVGDLDGNDLDELITVLRRVKNVLKHKAVLLHVKTQKGKGFTEAEKEPAKFHGVGKNLSSCTADFSVALGDYVDSIMEKNDKVFAITAGMTFGTGLDKVKRNHPDRLLDVGIAESYAVSLSAGMARGGLKPIVAIYSTFLQRAYDEILHDVCLSQLPVVFCIDRAGFVGSDGKSHQGLFDLSYLIHIPNISVLSPSDTEELKDALDYALKSNSPIAIRYPNGKVNGIAHKSRYNEELWEVLKEGKKICFLAEGPRMIDLAFKTDALLGGKCKIINARTIKPLDGKKLDEIKDHVIVTLEENSLIGGFGSFVSDYYKEKAKAVKILSFGAKDKFVKHGSVDTQLKENGLDAETIAKAVKGL